MNHRPAEKAFQHCEALARSHYENFSVGWFVPKEIRRHLFAVYAFARTADDFSDEEAYGGERLERLDDLGEKLDAAVAGAASEPLFVALAETFRETGLSPQLLKDLLKAFRQDVTKRRYQNYPELEAYCVWSANPIGRIVLHLFGLTDPPLLLLSDRICTGIQLVNHWQDVAVDLSRDRIYLPEEDLRRFGYSYEDLSRRRLNEAFRALMRFEVARTRSLFYEGRPLLKAIAAHNRRWGWQVALFWLGPMKILSRIEAADFDIFHARPKLSSRDLIGLSLKVLVRRGL